MPPIVPTTSPGWWEAAKASDPALSDTDLEAFESESPTKAFAKVNRGEF